MSEQINQFAKFQSTLPRRSDDTYGGDCSYTYGFQSTLPRRSDEGGEEMVKVTFISIHAPAKERPHQPAFELAY